MSASAVPPTPPPTLLLLTDRRQARRGLVPVVGAAVEGGARHVVLREKDLPREERLALAEAIRALLAPVGGRLIAAGPDLLRGDALHLAAVDLPVRTRLVGRSCHGEADFAHLSTEDYITLSPIFASESKPGYGPPLGTDGLARLCPHVRVPVFALGGVTTPERAAACVAAGAHGVAVMGAVMRADDPATAVAGLLAALQSSATLDESTVSAAAVPGGSRVGR